MKKHPVLIMSLPETNGPGDCVPVSEAEKPGAARDLPLANPAATGGVKPQPPEWSPVMGAAAGPGWVRKKAERMLWELEAVAELMAADLGPATARGRLLACRWAAARALFLEVLETHEPAPRDHQPIGSPWERLEESGLMGRLCQRHGWQCVSPGLLARRGSRADG